MKTRRIIASVLAFIMATTAAASSVFAAGETVKFSATKAETEAGAPFSVDISLSDVPVSAIMSCEFAIKYDASVLSITDVKAGAITNTGSDSAEGDVSGDCPSFFEDHSTAGTINLTWSTGLTDKGYWISKDGVFATISGTVAAGATAGEYPIEIVAISREDLEGPNNSIFVGYIENGKGVEYATSVTNGAVIVGGKTLNTTTTPTGTTTTTTSTTVTTTVTTGSSGSTGTPNPNVRYGDTNLDDSVSMIDVVYLNKYIAKIVKFNDQQMANADCALDGELNAADAGALLDFCAEKYDSLPINIG